MIEHEAARQIIREMPKVELHVHLEGAFTFDLLFNLIKKYGGDPTITDITDLKNKFVFRNFPHFIETWIWKIQFFREPEDFQQLAYSTLEHFHAQHIVYVEAFYSPWDFLQNNVSVQQITTAVLRGIGEAEARLGIKCRLIADISRDLGWETAEDRFQDILPYRDQGIIGIGLGGSEHKYPPEPFATLYHLARENGFHVVAHAGEAAGPESIWGAINALGVERIGHGVRAIEDPLLVNALKESQLPLEVCVSSNVKTAVFPSYEEHSIRALYESGIFITINSDDPTMFGATLTDEYVMLHEKLHFSLAEIKRLSLQAVAASFLSEAEKRKYENRMLAFWQDKI